MKRRQQIGLVTKPLPQQAEPDLNFENHDTLYHTHGLHPFAARCPPQLARWAIEEFTRPGDTILDPMVGSGTTMVEARLLGRHCYGIDIDPLARLISKVKSTPLPLEELQAAAELLLKRCEKERSGLKRAGSQDVATGEATGPVAFPQLPNLDYWFLSRVRQDLTLLKRSIAELDTSSDIKDFFYVGLSSLIVAKKSVANARDVSHSRHHYFKHESDPDVLRLYRRRLTRMMLMMRDFVNECNKAENRAIQTLVNGIDARAVGLPDNSVDLIFTSPPYCNAIDYPRAHRFSVAWLSDILNTTVAAYTELGKEYIGTERRSRMPDQEEGGDSIDIPLIRDITSSVKTQDKVKGRVVLSYFIDMFEVLKEMLRVLKPEKRLVLVVCPSHLRKIEVPSHKVFIEMGKHLRFQGEYFLDCERLVERTMDDGRRLLPYMREAFGERMRTEFVIVLRKVNHRI